MTIGLLEKLHPTILLADCKQIISPFWASFFVCAPQTCSQNSPGMTVLSIGNKTKQNRVYTEPYWNHRVMTLRSRVREPLSTAAPIDWSGRSTDDLCIFPCLVTSSQGQVQQLKAKSRWWQVARKPWLASPSSHVGFIVLQSSRVKKDVSEVMGKEKRK